MSRELIQQLESRAYFAAAPVQIRVNQVGYLPSDPKTAYVLSAQNLAGDLFKIVDKTGVKKSSGTVGVDRGAYASFAHLYQLDFSRLRNSGRYRIKLAGATSLGFTISKSVYQSLIPTSFTFFEVQRSGNTDPLDHGPSHLTDGTASGGPLDGQHVDVAGGWYDAGDYLKFILSSGEATALMLSAYEQNPNSFIISSTQTPQVLAETKVELDWYLKMWDPAHQVLYYQVGDASDHDVGWRLPEVDDTVRPNRPVFACEPGKGANLAGKMAANLALGAKMWGDPTRAWYNPTLAHQYATAAAQVFAWGKSNQAVQDSTDDFYDEDSWKDDMALGGAELYRLTKNKSYLSQAETWANAIGAQFSVDYGDLNALAVYELARLDPTYKANAVGALKEDLQGYAETAAADQWGLSLSPLDWGSGALLNGAALESEWYQNLTGDTQYHAMAVQQLNYMLGENPWGVCMVNSAGSVWPHHPHHQIADIKNIELVGYWAEGPVPQSTFDGEGITLKYKDAFAAFQTSGAVFHDDTNDYTTNEPTLDTNGSGIAITSWFAD